ncbi:MAG: CHRD domain-containing protein [Candidatus Eisenbacteria bacterium]
MRSRAAVALALLALGVGVGSAHAQASFTAKLTGSQEVPAVGTAAQGTASFTVTSSGLLYYVTVEGLSGQVVAAHIHAGPAGVGGGVVFDLSGDFNTAIAPNTATGIWTPAGGFTAARLAQLMAHGLYINVHTAANPGGEIRGQIYQSAGVHLSAVLSGAEENPGIAPAGTGTASFTLSEEGLAYEATVTNMTGAITAAHIHRGAIGVNGGVFQATPFTGTSAVGFIPRSSFTAADAKSLILGNMYFNVHTGANPAGETRGQIKLDEGLGFAASMNGAQEVPPTAAGELGSAVFTLTPLGLRYDITVSGLTGAIIAAHFHNNGAGANGPVVRDILPDFAGGTTCSGVWLNSEGLTGQLINELLNGKIYVNVHTAANPGGEIRGQLLFNSPGSGYEATLTSAQEEPVNASTARGTCHAELVGPNLVVRVTVDGLTGAITAAHIHNSPIGVGGGVVFNLGPSFVGNTCTATWAIPAASVTDLYKGNLYVNVHTAANPGGEIRGQLLPSSGTALNAELTATQEVPANGSTALGIGTCRLTPDGMAFSVTVDGLTGAISAAHIHRGDAGVAGPVVRDILPDFTGRTASGVWKPSDPQALTTALITELLRGNLYFNVHTAANPGGEIRGQIKLAGGMAFMTQLIGGAENPPVATNATGVLSSTMTDMGLVFRTSVNDLPPPGPRLTSTTARPESTDRSCATSARTSPT